MDINAQLRAAMAINAGLAKTYWQMRTNPKPGDDSASLARLSRARLASGRRVDDLFHLATKQVAA